MKRTATRIVSHLDDTGPRRMWVIHALDAAGDLLAVTQGHSPEVALVMLRDVAHERDIEIPDDLTEPPST